MKMPDIRKRMVALAAIADMHGLKYKIGDELRFLAEATKRRPYVRRKRVGPSDTLTPAMKRYAKILRNDGMAYPDIGRIIGCSNVGRISEACTGKAP